MRLFFLHVKFWGKRLMFGTFLLFLLSLFYFFRISQIQLMDIQLINPFFKYTSVLDFKTYILLYFISAFILNYFFFVLLTIYFKNQKRKKEKFIQKSEDLYIQKFINHLILTSRGEQTTEFNISTVRKYLKRNKTAPIFLDILYRIHSKLKGDLIQETNLIVRELGVQKIIGTYLYSPYLKDKILALKIISAFQLEGYTTYIKKLTSSKISLLRTEAFISLIKLSVLNDLSFLKSHPKLVSLWDINNILNVCRNFGNYKIDYLNLIQSEYPRVSALGILLANENRRYEFKEMIRDKIPSQDEILKKEAYLGFLSMADQLSDFLFLSKMFAHENNNIKKLIVNSFIKCPDKTLATKFLVEVVEKETLWLKTCAMKCLLEIDANKVQLFKDTTSQEVMKAHKEAVDFYIT